MFNSNVAFLNNLCYIMLKHQIIGGKLKKCGSFFFIFARTVSAWTVTKMHIAGFDS